MSSRPEGVGEALSASSVGAGALVMLLTEVTVWRPVALVGLVLVCLGAVCVLVESRLAAALTMVVVGSVAVVVAGVVAWSWWPVAGPSGETGGAGLCVLGGLGLTVTGGVRVGRAVHGWWRAVLGLAAVVLMYSLLMPLGVAVYATHSPTSGRHPTRPAALPTSREVTVVTADGVTLAGWYVPSTNRAAVVLLHGSSSDRTAVVGQAQVLTRHGYGVLMMDARGQGASGGDVMKLGWSGDSDVVAQVDYLQRQPDVDPQRVGAVGLSMGGEEALGAMAADGRIRATVAEGATGRVLSDRAWLSDAFGVRGWLQRGVDRVTYTLTDLLTPATPPISLGDAVAAAAPRPVLLIAGGATEEPFVDMAIRRRAPRSVVVWVVPSAGHTGGLSADPAGWEQRVVGFLDAALR